ncbi:LWXIA domain-containing protein [Burkholderia dolosa]|uniref:LWXIA domain-containing protein n=1 Tax=Burkholderia dolosa TaxID=152500 RepID=UPI0027D2800B|nr:LWXIA domain-containing protein [Burkholderia dolosa]
MLLIDGLGLGVNWQRFLSETLNPVVAPPPPPPPPPPKKDDPAAGPANPAVSPPPIPVDASLASDPSKPTNAEISSATSLIRSMAAQYTAPPPEITVENDKTRAVQKAIQDAQTKYDHASQTLQGAQNVLHLVSRDPESTADDRKTAQADYAKARTAADTAQRELNVTTDAGYMILYGEQANADMPAGMKIDDSGNVTDAGDAQHAADQQFKTLLAAFPDHANDPKWVPQPSDCKNPLQIRLYDDWQAASAKAAVGASKYYADVANSNLAYTQFQSYLADPDYKAALDAGVGRLNDALKPLSLQVTMPERPDSADAAQQAVTSAAKDANYANAAYAAANDNLTLANAQLQYDSASGKLGPTVISPGAVADAKTAVARAQTAANTSGGYLQMLSAQRQVDTLQADYTKKQDASNAWHKANPHAMIKDPQVDLDLGEAYAKLYQAQQQADIAHDGFVAAYGATLAQQYDDQASQLKSQVNAQSPLLKPSGGQPLLLTPLPSNAAGTPTLTPGSPTSANGASPLLSSPLASSPFLLPQSAHTPAAPTGPTMLDVKRMQMVAGAVRAADARLSDAVNERATNAALAQARTQQSQAKSTLASVQQQYDDWAAAHPAPTRFRTMHDGDMIPLPTVRPHNPYQDQLDHAKAAVTQADNAVQRLQLLSETSHQQVLMDRFDAGLDERLRYAAPGSDAENDYKKALHDFYEAHRGELSNSLLDAASASTQNGNTIAFGKLTGNEQRNLIGVALGIPPDVPGDPSSAGADPVSPANDDVARFTDKDKLKTIDSLRDKLLSIGGGGDTRVNVLPMVYAAKDAGMTTSALFKVTGKDGSTQYVDETGSTYSDIDDYLDNNELSSDGTVDIATGHNADGTLKLVSKTAHHESGFDRFLNTLTSTGLNIGMMVGGMALEGIGTLLDGTGIGAVVGVPLNILGAGMMYTAIGATMTSAGLDLATRAQHGRSINPFTDAGARADFINLVPMGAAGAAKLAGSKLFTRAVTTLTRTPKVASVLATGARTTAVVTGVGGAVEAFGEAGVDYLRGNHEAAGEELKAGITNVALMAAGGLKERAVTSVRTRTGRPVPIRGTDGKTVAVDNQTIGRILNQGDASSLAAGRTRVTLDGQTVKVSPDGTLRVGDKVLTYENKPIRVLDRASARRLPPGESVVLGNDGTLSVVSVSPKAWTNGTRIDKTTVTGERMSFGADGELSVTPKIVAKTPLDILDHVLDQATDAYRRSTAAQQAPSRLAQTAAESETASASTNARSTRRTSEERARVQQQRDEADAQRSESTRANRRSADAQSMRWRPVDTAEPAGAGARPQPDGAPPRTNPKVVNLAEHAPAARAATTDPAGIPLPRGPRAEPIQVGDRTVYVIRSSDAPDSPAARTSAPRPENLDEPVIVVAGEHDATLAPELANRWQKPVYSAAPDAFGADGRLRADARVLRFDPAPDAAVATEAGLPAGIAPDEAAPAAPHPAAADDTVIVLAGKRGPNEPAMPRPAAASQPVSALDGVFSAPNRVLVLVKPERTGAPERTAEPAAERDTSAAGRTARAADGADVSDAGPARGGGAHRSAANDDIGLAAAHPETTETAPADHAASTPGWVARMQMRFGGAPLPEAAQALAMQSDTLATQLRMLKDAGWRVTLGKRGGGSRIDPRKRRVTIDGDLQHPGSITYTLAHEARHAVEAMAGVLDLDYGSRSRFTRKALEAEARAQINAFEARYEIQLAGGGDIAAHVRLPDAIEREGAAWRAPSHDYAGTVDRLVDAFADAPVSGRDGERYRDFYHDVWARQKRRGGIPRRMPAPHAHEAAGAPRGVRSFDDRVAWSRAHAEVASPYRAGERPDAAELAAERTRHFTLDPERRVVVLHADTRADGALLADGRPVGAHEYALDVAPRFAIRDGYSIVLSAQHGGEAHAAQLANVWRRPVYAAPPHAVGPNAALLDTGMFRRVDPAPAAPHDIGSLRADPLGVYADGDRTARVDVARTVGELLGTGDDKTVFALGHDAALGVYDPNPHRGAPDPVRAALDERVALDDLRAYGLRTVTMSGPFSALGRVGVLYRPLGVLHSGAMRDTGALPRVVTRAALEHVQRIREVVEREGLAFDLQGLFTRDGDFLLSDPGALSREPAAHRDTLAKLADIERALAHGLERHDIELAHPRLSETPAPDAFVQKPSAITRIRMRFGGAPLPKEAYRLIDASSLLSQQLRLGGDAGWKVVRGKPGDGSKIDTRRRRITIDGGLQSAGSMVYVLAHEARHAVEAATGTLGLDYGSTQRYVQTALLAEARAQLNAFAVRDEIRAGLGVDIGRHVALPDAIASEYGRAQPGDAASIARLARAFEHAPTSLEGGITYGDLYRRHAQAAQRGDVTLAAPARDTATTLAEETAWSRARPVKASPFDGRRATGVGDLRLERSGTLSYDRDAGIVIVHGVTDAQGRLVDPDGRPYTPVEVTLAHRSVLGLPGSAVILSARNGRDAAAWLANVWQRPVYAPPTIAVGHGAQAPLAHTNAWLRYDPAPHERPDLGALDVDANGVHAAGDPAARVPVERYTGAATGAGIEKTVFELGRRNAIGLYEGTDNRAILGHIESIRLEQEGLAALRAHGLRTLTVGGPFAAFDRVAVMYTPFASLSSHDVMGGVLPARVTRDAFAQLDRAREITARHRLYYDFEGVFDARGDFYLSDPSTVMTDAPKQYVEGIVREIGALRTTLEDGIGRGAIELAHPAVAEHLPPDAFVQKPSAITRVRMRFGGAPLPKSAHALIDRSSLLRQQVAFADAAGWKVVVGRPGRGSRIDTAKQRIVLDGRLYGTGTLVYTLAHEAQHAVEVLTHRLALDRSSPDALTGSALLAEARAQANAFAVRREILDDAGIDIAKDAQLPDAIAREADRVTPDDAAGLQRLAAAFGDATPSVPGHATYRAYYASQADAVRAHGAPREIPAPAGQPASNAPVPARAATPEAAAEQHALDHLASHGKRDLIRIDGAQLASLEQMKEAFGTNAHVLIATHEQRPDDAIDARHPQPKFVASLRTDENGAFVDKTSAHPGVAIPQDVYRALKDNGAEQRAGVDFYLSPVPLSELRDYGGAARITARSDGRTWEAEPAADGPHADVVATLKSLADARRYRRPKQAAHAAGDGATLYAIEKKTGKVLGYATRNAAHDWTYHETTSLGDATIEPRDLGAAFRRRARNLSGGRRGVRFVVTDVAHDVVERYGGFAPAEMRKALGDEKPPMQKLGTRVQRGLAQVDPGVRRKIAEIERNDSPFLPPKLVPDTDALAIDFSGANTLHLMRALELNAIRGDYYVYVYETDHPVAESLHTRRGIIAIRDGNARWFDDVEQLRDPQHDGRPLDQMPLGRGPFGANQHFLLSRLAPDAFEPRATATQKAALAQRLAQLNEEKSYFDALPQKFDLATRWIRTQIAGQIDRVKAVQADLAAAQQAARQAAQPDPGGAGNNAMNRVRNAMRGKGRRGRGANPPRQKPPKAPKTPAPEPLALRPYQPSLGSSTVAEWVMRYGDAKVSDWFPTVEHAKAVVERKDLPDGGGLVLGDPPQTILADAPMLKALGVNLRFAREVSSMPSRGPVADPGGRHNRFVKWMQEYATRHSAARMIDKRAIHAFVREPAAFQDRVAPMARAFNLRDDPALAVRYVEQYGGAMPVVSIPVDPHTLAAARGGKHDPAFIRRARRFGSPIGARYNEADATITRKMPDGTTRTLELDDVAHLHKWLTASSRYGFQLRLEAASGRPLVSADDRRTIAGTNDSYAEYARIMTSFETWAHDHAGEPAPNVMLSFHGWDAVLEPVPGAGHVELLDALLDRKALDWVHVGLSYGTHGADFIANQDLTRALAERIVDYYRTDHDGKFARLHGADALSRVFEPPSPEAFANQQQVLFAEIARIGKSKGMSDDALATLRSELYERNTTALVNQARKATIEHAMTQWTSADRPPATRTEKLARRFGERWLDEHGAHAPARKAVMSKDDPEGPLASSRAYWQSVVEREALANGPSKPISVGRQIAANPKQAKMIEEMQALAQLNALRVHRPSFRRAELWKSIGFSSLVAGAGGLVIADTLGATHLLRQDMLSSATSSFLLGSRLGRVFQVMHQGAVRSLQAGDPKAAQTVLTRLEVTLSRQLRSGAHDYGRNRRAQLEQISNEARTLAAQYVELHRLGLMSFDDATTHIKSLAADVLAQMQGTVGGTSLQQLHTGNPRHLFGIAGRAGAAITSTATLAVGISHVVHAHGAFDLAYGSAAIASGAFGATYAGLVYTIGAHRVNADKRSRVVRFTDSASDFMAVAYGGLGTGVQWSGGHYDLAIATGVSTALLLGGRLNTHFPNATPLIKKIPTAVVLVPVGAFAYKLIESVWTTFFGSGSSNQSNQSNQSNGAQSNLVPGAPSSTAPSSPASPPSSAAPPSQPGSQQPPAQSQQPTPQPTPQPYIVVEGDSLWVIADRHRQSLLDAAHVSRADQHAMTRDQQDARALTEILQLNPNAARDPSHLPVGMPLNVG